MRSVAALFVLVLLAVPAVAMAQATDTMPPTLTAVQFNPDAVDVTGGSQVVTVSLWVTDDLSGVSWEYLGYGQRVGIVFRSPSGIQTRAAYEGQFTQVDGGPLGGQWNADVTIPQGAEGGDWYVESITLEDAAGNKITYDTTALAALAFPTTINVTSAPDTTPPVLLALSVDQSSVDTSSGAAQVVVTVHLTDDNSGVDFSTGDFNFGVLSPVGNFIRGCGQFILKDGTPQDGTWESTCWFPQYSQAGTWIWWGPMLWDAAGNSYWVQAADLELAGAPPGITLTSDPSDTAVPQVTAFSFDPTFIDTSLDARTVTVTTAASDDISGFGAMQVTFVSPSGGQQRTAYVWNLVSGSGDRLNGVFEGQVVFPQYSESGTWHVQQLFYYDNVFNYVFVSGTDAIASLGFPTVLNVVLASQEGDGTIGPDGGTVTDGAYGDRAELTLPPGAVAEDTTVAIDVLESPLTFPMPAGFAAPGTYYVNISFTPEPAMPFPAPGATVVLPLVNPLIPGTSLALYSVDAASGSLVPSESVFGGPVIGTVDAGGLSATFAGVAHFSVVVALMPDDEAPIVTPPTNISVTATEAAGARGSASPTLAAFLADGSATDNLDPAPARLSPQVGGVDVNNSTLFPLGATTVTFLFRDTAGNRGSATATVTVTPANSPPVADAGPDQTVTAGSTVQLSGAGSSDADGNPLTYAWAFLSKPAGSAAVLSNPSGVSPTFVADQPGAYVVKLIVNDGLVSSGADTVAVTATNSAPVADAGPDQTVTAGSTVQLSGAGSSDVDGNPLTYAWAFLSKPAGSAAVLSNPSGVSPTFVADQPGAYVVKLIVNDGLVSSGADTVAVTATNSAPVADAGPDQTVTAGSTVQLSGAGSSDADGNPLTYAWAFLSKPAGSAAVLSNPSGVSPTFVADQLGAYVVKLIVNDGLVSSGADTVAVTATNSAPVADAGPDQTVTAGSTVQLSGAGSSDADGNPLTYAWAFLSKPAGSAAVLSNPSGVSPTFVADQLGAYVVKLIVNDGLVSSGADTVAVTATNSAPVADAGPDQTVTAGSTVQLSGAGSSDVDGNPLTYAWAFLSKPAGSAAVLSNPSGVSPTFVADQLGAYVVKLIVNDGLVSSGADTVAVTATNSAPVADAGPDQTVTAGSTVQLSGAGSSDVDGNPLTYAWAFLSKPAGSAAVLSNPSGVSPTFVADQPGAYVVKLIVNDGLISSAADTVAVTVMQASPVLSARAAGRQVQLNWTGVSAAGYAVYRGTTAGGPYVKLAEVPGTQLMYIDGNRSVGATYYWVVRAITASGELSGPSNEVMAKIVGR